MFFQIILMLLFSCVIVDSYADDLNDGIALDKPINDDLTLDTNVQFIIRKALAKAKTKKKNSKTSSCGSGNIVIGAGSKVKEVINISTNTGTTAICGK